MSKDDLVGTDRYREITDGRLADLFSIDPHFSPRNCIQGDRSIRQLDRDGGHLARRHLDAVNDAIPEYLVHDFDLMAASRDHDAIGLVAPEQPAIFEQL